MKNVLILFLLCSSILVAQENTSIEFQEQLNEQYANPEKSPLLDIDRKEFNGLPFFPIKKQFVIEAKFEKSKKSKTFKMKTSTDRKPTYDVYGVATFTIESNTYSLNIYQSHSLRKKEEFKTHLFLPFTDVTNGDETYGGGRYIDLIIPEGDKIIIDFNKAYNPYCAYNHGYSCPVPPKENDLAIKIEAGVKYISKD